MLSTSDLIKGETYYVRYDAHETAIVLCEHGGSLSSACGIHINDEKFGYYTNNHWQPNTIERIASDEEREWLRKSFWAGRLVPAPTPSEIVNDFQIY